MKYVVVETKSKGNTVIEGREIKECLTLSEANRYYQNYQGFYDEDGFRRFVTIKEKCEKPNVYVGMPVWVFSGFSHERQTKPATVTKIGKKYFYCKLDEDQSSTKADKRIKAKLFERFGSPSFYAHDTKVDEFCEVYYSYEDYAKMREIDDIVYCLRDSTSIPAYDLVAKAIQHLYKEIGFTEEYEGRKEYFDENHSILTLYANKTVDGHRGDVYRTRFEAVTVHPNDEIILGFCVVNTITSLVPEGCKEWNYTVEEAIADFEKIQMIGEKTND